MLLIKAFQKLYEIHRNLSVFLLFSYYVKMLCTIETTKFSYQVNSHQIFHHSHFNILPFKDSYYFTLMLCGKLLKAVMIQNHFVFRKIHRKDSDMYSRKQVSGNLKFLPLNWVRISKLKKLTNL